MLSLRLKESLQKSESSPKYGHMSVSKVLETLKKRCSDTKALYKTIQFEGVDATEEKVKQEINYMNEVGSTGRLSNREKNMGNNYTNWMGNMRSLLSWEGSLFPSWSELSLKRIRLDPDTIYNLSPYFILYEILYQVQFTVGRILLPVWDSKRLGRKMVAFCTYFLAYA